MIIKQVADILPPDTLPPSLNALTHDIKNYKVLLFQPLGHLEFAATGVRNRDRELATTQFSLFLEDACNKQADLVVTPEYSMPWEVLSQAIKSGKLPSEGQIWALGCESIKYSEIATLKEDLSAYATVLYETLEPDSTRFINPLAYVFRAPDAKGKSPSKTIVLIQFKTHPMGDKDHFETNGLQKGQHVYQFGKKGESIRLFTLICSDVFALKDTDIKDIYDRSLIVHIQLNAKPRQDQFRRYRDGLFGLTGNATELICLNWARNVNASSGDALNEWRNDSLSAWYLKPDKFDDRDNTLCTNHKRGLYYTWFDVHHTHSLFFNFNPATFLLEATKVVHIGEYASLSRCRGPQLIRTCVWDDATKAWTQTDSADGGFTKIVAECEQAKDDLVKIAERSPLEAERVLMLSAGKVRTSDWYDVCQLDSFRIDKSEIIRRLTFCQDTDDDAYAFRVIHLKRFANLWNILKKEEPAPLGLKDFEGGFDFSWSASFPHHNSISSKDKRATVIYMGEEASDMQIDRTYTITSENLRKGAQNEADGRSAMQRLAVWYRRNNKLERYAKYSFTGIDQSGKESQLDITREK